MAFYILLLLSRKKCNIWYRLFFPLFSLQTKIIKKIMKVIKHKFRLRRKKTFSFSQHFQGQDNVFTFAAAGFIQPLGCCTKIAV